MKPNGEELASFTGGDPHLLESDPHAAAKAARTLVDRGVETVLATLGGNGAVLVTELGAWHAAPPPTTVVSTVGAGDSSLFGYLLGDIRQRTPAQRLALAVAYGSAAAGLPGTTIPHPSQVTPELVSVRDLDLTQGG
jgi:1-phosphofructokinase